MYNNQAETINHPLVTLERLNRKAIVYIRHSSRENIGSTARQRRQVELAQQYGWPGHLIEVIEDRGKIGSSIENRTGWERMLNHIMADGVGAVFAANASRLSRRVADYEQLQMLASDHGALLWLDDQVIDPTSTED
jgi:DNA invertase Pin-like site-specific DNA recombinase